MTRPAAGGCEIAFYIMCPAGVRYGAGLYIPTRQKQWELA
jgi:hypothetical protein